MSICSQWLKPILRDGYSGGMKVDMTNLRNKAIAKLAGMLAGMLAGILMLTSAAVASSSYSPDHVNPDRIRKELVTLPYYGVFDNISYQVSGGRVTLYGQVVRPSTRSDAERRISRLSGVTEVVNNIEVLPISSLDSSIRARTYRAVFGAGGLARYSRGTNPSIHIVVDRGHVILEGFVSSESDKNLAYIAASGVPGVFSVTNNLRVTRNL